MNRARLFITILLITLLTLLVTGCNGVGDTEEGNWTIGVINLTPSLDPVYDGFKAGMAELGYIEGENVTYIYDGPVGSIEGLDPAIQSVLEQDVDLIFSLSTPATQQVKQATEGTDVPVVFAPVNDPRQAGIVEDLNSPGSNITGIKAGGFIPKQLEWLITISPDTTRVLVPYNPNDASAVLALSDLTDAAGVLEVEILPVELQSAEEIDAFLVSPPTNVDAIFILPDSLVQAQSDEFISLALEQDLPLTFNTDSFAEAGALMTYGFNDFSIGEQAARLADQILRVGSSAGDLPVETAEFNLILNLATASDIGLEIPEEILSQAKYIVRGDE